MKMRRGKAAKGSTAAQARAYHRKYRENGLVAVNCWIPHKLLHDARMAKFSCDGAIPKIKEVVCAGLQLVAGR